MYAEYFYVSITVYVHVNIMCQDVFLVKLYSFIGISGIIEYYMTVLMIKNWDMPMWSKIITCATATSNDKGVFFKF